MKEIDIIAIEHACAKLQAQYCVCADKCDVDGFTALFAEDGSVKVPEYPAFVGHAAIRASMQALADSGATMRHLMSNSLIAVIDNDQAAGLCYLTAYSSNAPAVAEGWRPMEQPGTIGHYEDVFRRTPAGWRFASRILTRVLRKRDDPALQTG